MTLALTLADVPADKIIGYAKFFTFCYIMFACTLSVSVPCGHVKATFGIILNIDPNNLAVLMLINLDTIRWLTKDPLTVSN